MNKATKTDKTERNSESDLLVNAWVSVRQETGSRSVVCRVGELKQADTERCKLMRCRTGAKYQVASKLEEDVIRGQETLVEDTGLTLAAKVDLDGHRQTHLKRREEDSVLQVH